MTTNSITKNIRIEDKDEAKRLVTALEFALEKCDAEGKVQPLPVASNNYARLLESKQQIEKSMVVTKTTKELEMEADE